MKKLKSDVQKMIDKGVAKEWLARADGNMVLAIIGKYLIHALVFLFVIFLYQWYIFNVLHFPHLGGVWSIVRLSLLQVAASLGFGIFAFGLMPSLRMSMSISSLWFVLGISMCGSAFPVMGMDTPLQGVSWLFPSTFGARAFIRINSMGASVDQILPEIRILWIQAAAYLGMACLVYRHQFRLARKWASNE